MHNCKMMINISVQLILFSFLYPHCVAGSASAHTHNEVSHGDTRENRAHVEANTRIHSNRHGLILVDINIEIEEDIMMPVPLSAYRQDEHYSSGDKAQREPLRNSVDIRKSNFFPVRKNTDLLWTVSIEEIQVQKAHGKRDGTKSTPIPFSQTIRMEWNKTEESNEHDAERSQNHTASYAYVESKLRRNTIHYSGNANCTFMIPLQSDDTLSFAHSVPQTSSSLSRTFIVSLMLSSDVTPSLKSQNDNHWNRNQKYTVVTRRLATLPRESNSRSQRSINPVTNVFLHHSQRITHQEFTQIPESNMSEDNDSLSRPVAIARKENGYKESTETIQTGSNDKGGLLWTLVLLCTTYLIQSGPLQDKIKSLVGTFVQPLDHILYGQRYRVKDRHDKMTSYEYTIGGEYNVSGGGSDKNTIRELVVTDRRRDDEIESENGVDQSHIDTEPAHELGKFHDTNQQLGKKNVNYGVRAILCGQKNQSFSQRDGETIYGEGRVRFGNNHPQMDPIGNTEKNEVSYNLYGIAPVTERKTGDSITKLNKAGKHSDDLVDQDTDTQEMKLNRTEPSMVEDNPCNRSKTNYRRKEIQKSSHVTDYDQLETILQEKKQNDQTSSNGGCRGLRHHNENDSFLNDNAKTQNGCSIQGQETSKVDSTNSEEEKGKIGRCNDRLSKISDLADNNLKEKNISDNSSPTPGSPGSGQSTSNQSPKTLNCKKTKNRENYQSFTVQGYQSEESYVSTLPPDSDYVSDDDHLLLLSSCQHPEAQTGSSVLNKNSKKNELESISTNANRRKRTKISPRVGIRNKENSMSDAMFDKERHNKDVFESVKIVRVVNPVDKLGKRTRRPYSKSNYVADWVPSNELQSMSHDFLEERSWDITNSSNPWVKKSEEQPKTKKKKPNPSCSSSPAVSAHKKRFHGREN